MHNTVSHCGNWQNRYLIEMCLRQAGQQISSNGGSINKAERKLRGVSWNPYGINQ